MFSSRKESTTTKLTTVDTSQPTVPGHYKGKHKLKAGYASSLSVAYGSASEVEAERKALRRDNLIALGDWADTELEPGRALRGMVRAREPRPNRRKQKQKKPIVVIEQAGRLQINGRDHAWREERGLMLVTAPSYGGTSRYPFSMLTSTNTEIKLTLIRCEIPTSSFPCVCRRLCQAS